MNQMERTIQLALYQYFLKRGSQIFCDNCYLGLAWEYDFVSITPSGTLYESEIKISRTDFKRDFDKKAKHRLYRRAFNEARKGKKPRIKNTPSFFYYVCPNGVIPKKEVPDYAGLIYTVEHGGRIIGCKVVKKAIRLNYANKMSKDILFKIASSLGHRKFK